MKDHDPITNPSPEDLHAYGVGKALVWFSALLVAGLIVYKVFF